MNIKKKVRLNDFLSCLDPSTVVLIWIIDPDNGDVDHFIHTEVKFLSFKFIGSYYVQSVSIAKDHSFSNPYLFIKVMDDDLPF